MMTDKSGNNFVTKKELEITLEETLKVFSVDLLKGISMMMEVMKEDIKKELTEDALARHEETRRHFDVVAEDMFNDLVGANKDEMSSNTHKLKVHEEELNHHDSRLNHLELITV